MTDLCLCLALSLSYDQMMLCWERNPVKRPRFRDLVVSISDILEEMSGYMELISS